MLLFILLMFALIHSDLLCSSISALSLSSAVMKCLTPDFSDLFDSFRQTGSIFEVEYPPWMLSTQIYLGYKQYCVQRHIIYMSLSVLIKICENNIPLTSGCWNDGNNISFQKTNVHFRYFIAVLDPSSNKNHYLVTMSSVHVQTHKITY